MFFDVSRDKFNTVRFQSMILVLLLAISNANATCNHLGKVTKDTLIVTKVLHGFMITKGYNYEESGNIGNDAKRIVFNDKAYLIKSILFCEKGRVDSAFVFRSDGKIVYYKRELFKDSVFMKYNNWDMTRNFVVIRNNKVVYPEGLGNATVVRKQNDVICILGRDIYIYTCI